MDSKAKRFKNTNLETYPLQYIQSMEVLKTGVMGLALTMKILMRLFSNVALGLI